MPATSQYHVLLDGQGYLIDTSSYRREVAQPFAPKTRSGDPRYQDLQVGSAWAQESWAGGLGFRDHDPAFPDRYDLGVSIDHTLAGDIKLGRSLSAVFTPASATELYALQVYQGSLFATRGDGQEVYSSADGSTWATSLSSGKTALRAMALAFGWLLVGSGSDGHILKYDGTAWTNPWVSPTGLSVRSLAGWHPTNITTEFLYAGISLSGSKSELRRVDSAGTMAVIHTTQLPHIEAIIPWSDDLWYCAMSDIAGVRGVLHRYNGTVIRVVAEIPDNAISSFAVYRNRLYAGSRTRGKVWEVAADGLTEIWTIPDQAAIGGVSAYTFPIRGMVVENDRLHVAVVTTDGLGTYVFDGQGWSLPNTGGAGQEPRGIASFNSQVYLANKSAAGARIYRVNDAYQTSALLVSNWFDAELAGADKVWQRLTLFHEALVSGQSVTVDYALDGSGSWINLGLSNTVGATSKTFSFPLGTAAKRIRLRLTLVGTTTASPTVASVLVEYVVMADTKRRWRFDALLEGTASAPLVRLDNSSEPLTGAQLSDAIWTTRGRKQAVAFTDLDGEARTVYFAELEERVAEQSQRLGDATRGRVVLVEA